MAEVLLGVDIGTSSTKGVITHADGEVLATATRPHKTLFPQPGFVEHDPEAIWWKDFSEIVGELLPQADWPIAGVSVSGIGATTLPADADGEPLRDAILYGSTPARVRRSTSWSSATGSTRSSSAPCRASATSRSAPS